MIFSIIVFGYESNIIVSNGFIRNSGKWVDVTVLDGWVGVGGPGVPPVQNGRINYEATLHGVACHGASIHFGALFPPVP